MKRASQFAMGAAVGLAAACAQAPPSSTVLDDAQRLVAQAIDSGEVNRHAPMELARARETLARAERTRAERDDAAEAEHLAYLAAQDARLATSLAAGRAAEARIESASAERERLEADLRTRRQQAEAAPPAGAAPFVQTPAQREEALAADEAEGAHPLQRDLAPLSPQPTGHGLVLVLPEPLFETGRASLQPAAQGQLDQLASVLQRHPERRVRIEGFTDAESGAALSRARADGVRQALVARGIAPERVDLRAAGTTRPPAVSASAPVRPPSRRVEVVFSDGRGRFAQNP